MLRSRNPRPHLSDTTVSNIRPLEPADVDAVAAVMAETQALHATELPDIFHDAPGDLITADEAAAAAADPDQLWRVAILDDVVVGYLHAEVQRTPASRYKRPAARLHVHQMGVAAAHRGEGVGHALLVHARAEAQSRALPEVSLEVYTFNSAARAFYEREGFVALRELRVWRPRTSPDDAS